MATSPSFMSFFHFVELSLLFYSPKLWLLGRHVPMRLRDIGVVRMYYYKTGIVDRLD